MAKNDITIPPIRKNPRNGRITQHDAAVVIGNSRPDVIEDNNGNHLLDSTQPKSSRSIAKRKPKRSARIYFVPNKVTRSIVEEWKAKYGSRFYSAIINSAIEKYIP